MAPLVVYSKGPGHAFLRRGAFCISQWTKAPEVPLVYEYAKLNDDAVREHDRIVQLTVFHNFGPPSEPARRSAVEIASRHPGKLIAQAFVIPDEGVGASIIRMAVSGILLVAKDRSPNRVTQDLETALQFLRDAAPDDLDGLDTAELRAQLHPLQY